MPSKSSLTQALEDQPGENRSMIVASQSQPLPEEQERVATDQKIPSDGSASENDPEQPMDVRKITCLLALVSICGKRLIR